MEGKDMPNTVRAPTQASEPSEQASFPVLEIWRAALTLANNLCVKISDRYNGDDATAEANAAGECARSIRGYIDPGEALWEMLKEAGVFESVTRLVASAQHTPRHYNEQPEVWRRHFVADVCSARSAHRTAHSLRLKGYPPEFITQARNVRDASLVSARLSLQAYRAAVAKAVGSRA
jgi:hypothetical protein